MVCTAIRQDRCEEERATPPQEEPDDVGEVQLDFAESNSMRRRKKRTDRLEEVPRGADETTHQATRAPKAAKPDTTTRSVRERAMTDFRARAKLKQDALPRPTPEQRLRNMVKDEELDIEELRAKAKWSQESNQAPAKARIVEDDWKEQDRERRRREEEAQELRRRKLAEKLKAEDDAAIKQAAKKKEDKEVQRSRATTLPSSHAHHMQVATWQWEDQFHNWNDLSERMSLQLDQAEQSRKGRVTFEEAITTEEATTVTFDLNQRKMVVGESAATYQIRRCRVKQLHFVQEHREEDPHHDKWEHETDPKRVERAKRGATTRRGSQDFKTGFAPHRPR